MSSTCRPFDCTSSSASDSSTAGSFTPSSTYSVPTTTATTTASSTTASASTTSSISPTSSTSPTSSISTSTSPTTGISTSTSTSTTAIPSAAVQAPESSSSSSSSTHTGAIVGGVVGGVVFLSCLAVGLFLYMRRRRRKRIAPSSEFINSLRPGVTPILMLESGPAQVPEKSQLSHYLSSPPYQQDNYYASPSPSSVGCPDSTMSTERSPGPQKMEKPLVPNRYSAQQAAGNSRNGRVDSEDRRSSDSREWDGDPVIETPRRTRSRRPESAPAFPPRSSSSHHRERSHQQQLLPTQNSYPGVSPLAVSQPQASGLDRFTNPDDFASRSPPVLHRGMSLRPQRREDYERVWEER
ncbi:hypothetical protein F5J12DRAFT_481345 [Pisolithus orientalis]|uniref:uncharacterized protein n=1 Tax=Pisolithus orientalis TaxID=936130 RepID=UPI00222491DC|nr:uncharacterized protein F5J12DRAFT_481345 [Pisolithus orientalis]KAI6019662.1 hypothetical protein F5J12DRAFT_481345 [Pisolithus orientalis]